MPTLRAFIVELAVMLAVAFLLAAIGPYGSFEMGPFAARLAYWLPATLVGYALVRPVMIVATRAADRLELAAPVGLAAGVLSAAVPLTFFILWLNGNPLGRLPPFEGWIQLYLQVALIGGAVTALFWLLERRAGPDAGANIAEAAPPDPAEALAPPPFLSRLPPHLRHGLIALEMEDHYVRAHTTGGSALVLLRMRDAVSELSGIDGLQVHRSWWVARDAVERVTQDGRNVRLTLKGGLDAPIARSNIPALRAAGWLGRRD